MGSRPFILIALLLVLSAPFAVRALSGAGRATAQSPTSEGEARRLVIVTPHVEQIQLEFARGFDRWHRRTHNQAVLIDYRQPGGTSDIIKQLEASYSAAAKKGLLREDGSFPPGTAGYDLLFGGGSFEHGKLREVKSVIVSPGAPGVTFRMGKPAGFSQQQLDEWFGQNKIGAQTLYDPQQYWIGVALSGFGIVYNRDALKRLGLPEPASFRDLCDPRYVGNLAMTDGRQSGSITTTYESILNKESWDGWRTLRELAANARYFASAATKAPIDVGQGEAAAGLAIDFYGRGQAQFLQRPGEGPGSSRVGYVDPSGAVYIDADPVSMLNGATDEELARRFIEFCLTEEAQALWQFPALGDARSRTSPKDPSGRTMGPDVHELRRMPVRRVMYQKHLEHMADRTDPFSAASDVPGRGWRSAIGPLMGAFGIDTRAELVEAWRSLHAARQASASGGFPKDVLSEMERLFYAMPVHTLRPGSLYADPAILKPLSKPSRDLLTGQKLTTIEDLRRKLAGVRAGGKASPEVLEELGKLHADHARTQSRVGTLEFNEENFRAIRADTDSWRDPLHGRKTLVDYTTQFRENYLRVTELARRHLSRSAEPRS